MTRYIFLAAKYSLATMQKKSMFPYNFVLLKLIDFYYTMDILQRLLAAVET